MALRTLADALSTLSTPASTKSRQPQKQKLIDLLLHRHESCVDNRSPFAPRRQSTSQPRPVRPLHPFHRDPRQPHLTELTTTHQPHEPSMAEQQADSQIRFALTMLGVTTVGRLAFPPLLLLDLPAVLFIAWQSGRYAYQAWRQKGQITAEFVDLGIAAGIIASGYYGLAFGSFAMTSLCRKLLARTEDQSRQSLINVFGQQPRTVWVLADGSEVEVPFAQLQAGDTLIVGAGQLIAADGVVVDGAASVDQHILTGEAKPKKGWGRRSLPAPLCSWGKFLSKWKRPARQPPRPKLAPS